MDLWVWKVEIFNVDSLPVMISFKGHGIWKKGVEAVQILNSSDTQ